MASFSQSFAIFVVYLFSLTTFSELSEASQSLFVFLCLSILKNKNKNKRLTFAVPVGLVPSELTLKSKIFSTPLLVVPDLLNKCVTLSFRLSSNLVHHSVPHSVANICKLIVANERTDAFNLRPRHFFTEAALLVCNGCVSSLSLPSRVVDAVIYRGVSLFSSTSPQYEVPSTVASTLVRFAVACVSSSFSESRIILNASLPAASVVNCFVSKLSPTPSSEGTFRVANSTIRTYSNRTETKFLVVSSLTGIVGTADCGDLTAVPNSHPVTVVSPMGSRVTLFKAIHNSSTRSIYPKAFNSTATKTHSKFSAVPIRSSRVTPLGSGVCTVSEQVGNKTVEKYDIKPAQQVPRKFFQRSPDAKVEHEREVPAVSFLNQTSGSVTTSSTASGNNRAQPTISSNVSGTMLFGSLNFEWVSESHEGSSSKIKSKLKLIDEVEVCKSEVCAVKPRRRRRKTKRVAAPVETPAEPRVNTQEIPSVKRVWEPISESRVLARKGFAFLRDTDSEVGRLFPKDTQVGVALDKGSFSFYKNPKHTVGNFRPIPTSLSAISMNEGFPSSLGKILTGLKRYDPRRSMTFANDFRTSTGDSIILTTVGSETVECICILKNMPKLAFKFYTPCNTTYSALFSWHSRKIFPMSYLKGCIAPKGRCYLSHLLKLCVKYNKRFDIKSFNLGTNIPRSKFKQFIIDTFGKHALEIPVHGVFRSREMFHADCLSKQFCPVDSLPKFIGGEDEKVAEISDCMKHKGIERVYERLGGKDSLLHMSIEKDLISFKDQQYQFRKEKREVVVPFYMLEATQNGLTRCYPQFNLKFTHSTHSDHPAAAASRLLENHTLSALCGSNFSDIGGSPLHHLRDNSSSGVHVCRPVYDSKDAQRKTLRLDQLRKITLNMSVSELIENPSRVSICSKVLGACNHKSQALVMVQVYDASLDEILEAMIVKDAGVTYLTMVTPGEILDGRVAFRVDTLGCEINVDSNKDSITYKFGASCYTHRLCIVKEIMSTPIRVREGYLFTIENYERRFGVNYFKITKSSVCPTMNFLKTIRYERADSEIVRVALPKFDAKRRLCVPGLEYVYLDAKFVSRVHEYVMTNCSVVNSKTFEWVLSFIKSSKSRVVISGKVIHRDVELGIEHLESFAAVMLAYGVRSRLASESLAKNLHFLSGDARLIDTIIFSINEKIKLMVDRLSEKLKTFFKSLICYGCEIDFIKLENALEYVSEYSEITVPVSVKGFGKLAEGEEEDSIIEIFNEALEAKTISDGTHLGQDRSNKKSGDRFVPSVMKKGLKGEQRPETPGLKAGAPENASALERILSFAKSTLRSSSEVLKFFSSSLIGFLTNMCCGNRFVPWVNKVFKSLSKLYARSSLSPARYINFVKNFLTALSGVSRSNEPRECIVNLARVLAAWVVEMGSSSLKSISFLFVSLVTFLLSGFYGREFKSTAKRIFSYANFNLVSTVFEGDMWAVSSENLVSILVGAVSVALSVDWKTITCKSFVFSVLLHLSTETCALSFLNFQGGEEYTAKSFFFRRTLANSISMIFTTRKLNFLSSLLLCCGVLPNLVRRCVANVFLNDDSMYKGYVTYQLNDLLLTDVIVSTMKDYYTNVVEQLYEQFFSRLRTDVKGMLNTYKSNVTSSVTSSLMKSKDFLFNRFRRRTSDDEDIEEETFPSDESYFSASDDSECESYSRRGGLAGGASQGYSLYGNFKNYFVFASKQFTLLRKAALVFKFIREVCRGVLNVEILTEITLLYLPWWCAIARDAIVESHTIAKYLHLQAEKVNDRCGETTLYHVLKYLSYTFKIVANLPVWLWRDYAYSFSLSVLSGKTFVEPLCGRLPIFSLLLHSVFCNTRILNKARVAVPQNEFYYFNHFERNLFSDVKRLKNFLLSSFRSFSERFHVLSEKVAAGYRRVHDFWLTSVKCLCFNRRSFQLSSSESENSYFRSSIESTSDLDDILDFGSELEFSFHGDDDEFFPDDEFLKLLSERAGLYGGSNRNAFSVYSLIVRVLKFMTRFVLRTAYKHLPKVCFIDKLAFGTTNFNSLLCYVQVLRTPKLCGLLYILSKGEALVSALKFTGLVFWYLGAERLGKLCNLMCLKLERLLELFDAVIFTKLRQLRKAFTPSRSGSLSYCAVPTVARLSERKKIEKISDLYERQKALESEVRATYLEGIAEGSEPPIIDGESCESIHKVNLGATLTTDEEEALHESPEVSGNADESEPDTRANLVPLVGNSVTIDNAVDKGKSVLEPSATRRNRDGEGSKFLHQVNTLDMQPTPIMVSKNRISNAVREFYYLQELNVFEVFCKLRRYYDMLKMVDFNRFECNANQDGDLYVYNEKTNIVQGKNIRKSIKEFSSHEFTFNDAGLTCNTRFVKGSRLYHEQTGFLAANSFLKSNDAYRAFEFSNSEVDILLYEAPPGGGKTYTLVSSFIELFNRGAKVLALTANKSSQVEILKKVNDRLAEVPSSSETERRTADRNIYTIDSYLMNNRGLKCQVLFVDECFMMHAGAVIACIEYTGCTKCVLYGDSRQIHYVNRNEFDVAQFADLDSFIFSSSRVYGSVSYRCPWDVCAWLSENYPKSIATTNLESAGKSSMSIQLIEAVEDVMVLPNYTYLTFLQPEKKELQRYLKLKKSNAVVKTVHEAQGDTYANVMLVRTKFQEDDPFRKFNYINVAITRHTESLTYAVIAARQCDSIATAINRAQELVDAYRTRPTSFGGSVLDIAAKSDAVDNSKCKASSAPIGVINDFLNEVVPGTGVVDFGDMSAEVESQPFESGADNVAIRDSSKPGGGTEHDERRV